MHPLRTSAWKAEYSVSFFFRIGGTLVLVAINMLIAVMSNTYQRVAVSAKDFNRRNSFVISRRSLFSGSITRTSSANLRGCPCKNRPLDFRPKTEFLQIFRVRPLVHVINKNGNNLAFNAIFQYFWRQFQRTVQNRLNRSVSSQI